MVFPVLGERTQQSDDFFVPEAASRSSLPSLPASPCPLSASGTLLSEGDWVSAALVLSPPPPVWKAAGSPLSVRRPPVEAHTWDSGGTARSPP